MSRRADMWRWAGAVALLAAAVAATAQESGIADHVHLGPASCASSVCHGKLDRQEHTTVWLNEYRIWSGADHHSRAYRTLESEESQRMAEYLGLPAATTADICLDCHADNVPADKRGPQFQIRDGVGCEACHGGSERWIESHAAEGATHSANLAAGMYPTESPAERAALCLSCHMGSAARFVGHDIYGAGHPRLSFELEAFTANQPAHYEVDADYRERKGEIPGFNLWLVGQLESARAFAVLARDRLSHDGMVPELALYDCHACHHAMDDKRWRPARVTAGTPPGSLRLQSHHMGILEVVTGIIESREAAAALRDARRAFVLAGQRDSGAVRTAADELVAWLTARQDDWSERRFDTETVIRVRASLLQTAATGSLSDYAAAEQVYLSLESLSYTLGDRARYETSIDELYATVEDDATFSPDRFEATARRISSRF